MHAESIVHGWSDTARAPDGSVHLCEALATLYPGAPSADRPIARRMQAATSHATDLYTELQEPLPQLLGRIEQLVDTTAATALSGYLRLHAGVVAGGASGIIMPAPSGGGKSTLVAALCLSGFRYLSDEFALLDLGSSRVFPYPKSIGLKPAGWRLISRTHELYTDCVTLQRLDGQEVVYLKAPEPLPADASVPLDYVIVPRRRATGRATLTELPRSDALVVLLRQTLNLPLHGAPGLEALARLVESAHCFTLIYATLPDAVEQLTQLVRRA